MERGALLQAGATAGRKGLVKAIVLMNTAGTPSPSLSWDATPCKVTSVILHGVVSPLRYYQGPSVPRRAFRLPLPSDEGTTSQGLRTVT